MSTNIIEKMTCSGFMEIYDTFDEAVAVFQRIPEENSVISVYQNSSFDRIFIDRSEKKQILMNFLTEDLQKTSGELNFLENGQKQIISVQKKVINTPDGILDFVIASDITIKKRLEEIRNNFLAIVSHEIKTPLTIMLGYLSCLEEELKDNEMMKTVIRNAENLNQIIETLLMVSECFRDGLQLEKTEFDLLVLIEEVIKKEQDEYPLISFQKEFSRLPMFTGDPQKLKSALHGVISNSCKFSRGNGCVSVRTSVADNEINIEIKDSGIGVSEQNQAYVFEPFFQVEEADVREFGGIGLGLTMAKEVVRLHRGKIEFSSQTEMGTSVRIVLPQQPGENKLRILIVDDNDTVRKLLKRVLSVHLITEASDAYRALDLISENDFDLIFMDINMQGMDGIEATREIKKIRPDASVCFISGMADIDYVKEGIRAGAFDYIVKPFEIEKVRDLVKKFMHQR